MFFNSWSKIGDLFACESSWLYFGYSSTILQDVCFQLKVACCYPRVLRGWLSSFRSIRKDFVYIIGYICRNGICCPQEIDFRSH